MMEFYDLPTNIVLSILLELQKTYDVSTVEKKYNVSIPQWLIIIYRCVACAKETRSKIQSKLIRTANKQMICPFCRKVSKMFNIYILKSRNFK